MANKDYEPGRATGDPGDAAEGGRKPSALLIAALIVAALAVWFFLTNSQEANIDFLVTERKTTVRWSLLVAVALGVLLDRLVSVWWRRARRRR
jgi:hypothetical protein